MPETPADLPILAAHGEIDVSTSRELAGRLHELAGQAGGAVLDLTDVTLLDSVGLAVVLKAAGRFQRQGKQLVLVAPPGQARTLLDLAGTGGRVPVVDSVEDAVAALA
jgi:anti-anti-sigma factor